MQSICIDKVAVPAWNPAVHVSDDVGEDESLRNFLKTAPLAYETPEIVFSDLGTTVVTGSAFTVKSEKMGVVQDSFYLIPQLSWEQTLRVDATVSRYDGDMPALVIGNMASDNYYHWNFQCLASLLLFRQFAPWKEFVTVMPALNSWQSQTLSTIDFEGERFELDKTDIFFCGKGFRSNLTGGEFAFAPHVLVTSQFEEIAQAVDVPSERGRKIYASRLDAGSTRRILNEDAVCELMASYGFEIITPGKLTVEEQITTFRDADVIVGAHGAGMTNLLFSQASKGPRVVELFQSHYVNACYARICQAKGLDYTAVVSPGGLLLDENEPRPTSVSVNDLVCLADLGVIESVIAKL
ncbi:hypothetical protein CYG48_01145 [Neorhizobium sp. SOG26]|uniref:glycosyltransferase family 61 protein n=1 Tax=Neorhizobium sp. SOG26 TaxID=2060726 RepID=UPI000E594B3A|nr:glycosyltransferase family 61 protein [Neorhizobium sp. SOG26]AXV14444.1 hypothetical protein CYG48_01145 [Neorhizobium sp. SOG26]